LTTKHKANLGSALLWLAGLLILIKIAVSVAQELGSALIGVMVSALVLLFLLTLRSSLKTRR
jgi:hypothetical protein